jgi:hypothetical protein
MYTCLKVPTKHRSDRTGRLEHYDYSSAIWRRFLCSSTYLAFQARRDRTMSLKVSVNRGGHGSVDGHTKNPDHTLELSA